MNLRLASIALLLSAPVLANGSGGDSFNVDIGSLGYGFGTPQPTYGAAAGSPGTWNAIDSDAMAAAGSMFNSGPLLDLTGAATAVTIDFDAMGFGFLAYEFNEPFTTGDDEALMDDIYYVGAPNPGTAHTITVNNLAAGTYRVYVYAMAPDNANELTTVNVPGSADPLATVGGDFSGGFVRDVTHSEHVVTIAAGAPLVIEVDYGGSFDSVNGLQIVKSTPTALGTNYCTANPNSTGSTGAISALGSDVAADNDVTLTASQLPPNAFGFFLTSTVQGFVMTPGGSAGNLCISGSPGRYVGTGQIQNSGAGGSFSLVLDLTQTPTPTGFVATVAGDTRYFQTWHRDSVMGTATSNFTDGLCIVFQ